MTPQQRERAQAIFAQAIREPADSRDAFIEQRAGDDPDLLAELRSMLSGHAKARATDDLPWSLEQGRPAGGNFPIAAAAAATQPLSPHPGLPTSIGPYRLLQELGEGGMGIVYLAEQLRPVRRRVALKVIRPGMDSRQVIARFEAERQALAMMDHPNIARVYDAGTTENGRPYFVMELVQGVPITQYCDQQRLTPRQRLELFVPVCQAIQHAHQKGIIHRDLKPSNVLITSSDGGASGAGAGGGAAAATPVAKVIDFGVAKALHQPLTDKTLFTQFGNVIGTLEYMSPEQTEQDVLGTDTRSDIYSLGVLLYELLTGTTPHDPRKLREASYEQMLRTIREQEPPRPSTRLAATGDEALASLSALRRSEPTKLPRLIAGDLDWVVMKCLEKDRARRYETANGLANDIGRYLRNEPVQARPPSAGYRLRKLAQRHKVMLVTIGIVASSLLAGTIVSVTQWIRATHARELAQSLLATELREHNRVAEAERAAMRRLFDARLAQAQANRQSGRIGRRLDSLRAISEAASVARDLHVGPEATLKLRNEAIAALALIDLRLDHQWEGYPVGSTLTGTGFDAPMERYARVDPDGRYVTVRRLADDQVLTRIAFTGAPATTQPNWRLTMVFSPDGQLLASGGHSGPDVPTEVWDLRDGKSLLKAAPVGGFERKLDFSPDSRLLACGGPDGWVTTYDVRSAKQLNRFSAGGAVRYLRFHPLDNHLLAIGVGSQLRVVDLDGKAALPPINHGAAVTMIAWSADGQMLASIEGKQVFVWNATTGERLAICSSDEYMGYAAFSHSGELLVSSSLDATSYLWDPRSGRELYRTAGTAGEFSPDDRWLAFGVFGPGVGRWEVVTGGECRTLCGPELNAGSFGLGVNPQGNLLTSAAINGVRLWDLKTARLLATVANEQTSSAAFDPSGKFLITSGKSGFRRWPLEYGPDALPPRVKVGSAVPILPPGTPTQLAAMTPDRRTAVVNTGRGQLLIVDLTQPKRAPLALNQWIGGMDLSPDGKWIATSPMDVAGAKLWDAKTAKWVRDFPGIPGAWATFSPDNRWLVYATPQDYRFLRVGSWEPGPQIARDYGGHSPGPVAFSRDGKMLAITHDSRLIKLIEPDTGRELATLTPSVPQHITALSFTPDNSQLATATSEGLIQLWDLRRCREQLGTMEIDWDEPPTTRPR
jgi:serine/threonine protein kinase/WD40 repeat protein